MKHILIFLCIIIFCSGYFFTNRIYKLDKSKIIRRDKSDLIRMIFWDHFLKVVVGCVIAIYGIYGFVKLNLIGLPHHIISESEFRSNLHLLIYNFSLPLIVSPILLYRYPFRISEDDMNEDSVSLTIYIINRMTLVKNILGCSFLLLGILDAYINAQTLFVKNESPLAIYSLITVVVYDLTLLLSGAIFLLNYGSSFPNTDYLNRVNAAFKIDI